MAVLTTVVGLLLVLLVLQDAFETIVLPRRVVRRFRLTRLFFQVTWGPWSALAGRVRADARRERYLGFFGPLSLLLLLAVWALGLVIGFALVQWGLRSELMGPEGRAGFWATVYMSGTTFFTLGIGDITPRTPAARVVTVLEAGTGFGFLALVIGYLPVLYQAFSRREVSISLLDARAGSPPTAAELLRRCGRDGGADAVGRFLGDWERWSAELLESHLSYPVLAFYRSQHEHQSWVASLTMILDACALLIAGAEGAAARPARLTFAMARHAAVDLSQIFARQPDSSAPDRLPPPELALLRLTLAEAGVPLRDAAEVDERLAELRRLYEPYVAALAGYLLMMLPSWLPPGGAVDDWQSTAAERRSRVGR